MARSTSKGRTASPIKGARKGTSGSRSNASRPRAASSQQDVVNRPPHYTFTIEVIDAIEAWGLDFRLANVVKYVARAAHKGSQLDDLKKARWYLDRTIGKLEAGK
jgi:hypothetical protein